MPFPLFIHFCPDRLGELCIMPLSSPFFALPAFFHPAEGKSGVEETVTDAQKDRLTDASQLKARHGRQEPFLRQASFLFAKALSIKIEVKC